ncbi:DEAD/DEAH box helicase family protein [Mesorhizobium sp. B4-1-4]|uniref:DEAD/DEAH box helicase family protein n=1 Tax=Mesorhizobium sp. B4-1-4 TaxID=2589888 RepID=UPI001129BCA4|nr:DEAD/DEAH box helicase family protein [Mesorhizobium sp. B4-1-4]UCI29451.1 DEAD/DEAH box helicase family protein [Mesorhizobium sp. B4-1-4]
MLQRQLHQIKARLSLRTPQAEALDILADVLDTIEFSKGTDVVAALDAIKATYPTVTDFERDFPSLCFALATGVGKTRLMGAFIAYLYLTGRSKHFFILAPNTTIYDKLVADFSQQNSQKYVFKGIAEFAQLPPIVETGDNWERGYAVRGDLLGQTAIVFIFNVDKINKEQGRIRKLHEYIGESYFEYLSGLPDLVLLMDEAHRYRAKAGMNAIAELKPVIGLELTATPRSVGAKSVAFKNVVVDYPLGQAMADGYVKDPAVATREGFRVDSVTREQLEGIKLEDGIHCHEHTKAELAIYAQQTGRKLVHPFMLVVAQDTMHASEIRRYVESDDFFQGRYRGRVIEVHSGTRGEETEEATEKLVALEHDAQTDIVIHVNKLKEGWDVTNLYTIVPLRASASDILTEQTLGRGLRLPYGQRTGVEAVDRLTIIAHDRFDDVIKAARDPDSLISIRKTVIVGGNGDVSDIGAHVVQAPSNVETLLTGTAGTFDESEQKPYVFETQEEREVARITWDVIEREFERRIKTGIEKLETPEVQAEITRIVKEAMAPEQGTFETFERKTDVAATVAKVTKQLVMHTISIPEIVVLPTSEVNFGFNDFDLSNLEAIAKQPLSDQIMVQRLRDESRAFLARTTEGVKEERLENYLVRHLMDLPQVDYETQSELLFKLSGQTVKRLESYLATPEDVENVLIVHGKDLARFIFGQMQTHYWETATDYRASVSRGFIMLKPQAFNVPSEAFVRDFRTPVNPLSQTPKHVFEGFAKCCYPYQKFDSDTEREFAVILESKSETGVLRWMKPGIGQFRIEYAAGQSYEPDFVVETDRDKFIVEIKAKNEMSDPVVQAKAKAARKWVHHANDHAKDTGGKPWTYVLIPHDTVKPSATLASLVSAHSQAVALI